MTAREWTIVALRALLSLVLLGGAVVGIQYGQWIFVVAAALCGVWVGVFAYVRYHDFRFHAEYRRHLR